MNKKFSLKVVVWVICLIIVLYTMKQIAIYWGNYVPSSAKTKYYELANGNLELNVSLAYCKKGLDEFYLIRDSSGFWGFEYYYDFYGNLIDTYQWSDIALTKPPIQINKYDCTILQQKTP